MIVIQNPVGRVMTLPVYGAGADLAAGSLLMPGVTAQTNLGVLINGTTTSNADCIGVLSELHDYSESGDALVDGTVDWYYPYKAVSPSHKVELINTAVIVRCDYNTATVATVTGQTTVAITASSLEDNIDTSWFYTVGGTGPNQLFFLVTSGSGTCTVYSAPTTSLSTDTTFIKILRLFHRVVVWTAGTATAGTKIGTTEAVGTGRALILANHIVRNGYHDILSPLSHHNLSGLASVNDLRFYAEMQIQDTGFHPVD